MSAEMMVFTCHLSYHGVLVWPGPLAQTLEGMRSGVLLFFVLSGYLLYRPFVLGRVATHGYLLRRCARILPAYWVALVGVTLLSGDHAFVRDPLRFVVFGQNYDSATFNGFLGVSWTLVLEVMFYVTLPVIAAVIRRSGVGLLIAAGVASFIGQQWAWTLPGDTKLLAALFPMMFWAFVPGMLLARFEGSRHLAWLRSPLVAILGGATMFLGFIVPVNGADSPIAVIGATLLVGFAVARPEMRLPRWVAGGAAITYSAYLWHVDIMRTVRGLPAGPLLAAIAVVVVASLIYVSIEAPINSRARRHDPRVATPIPFPELGFERVEKNVGVG
jgi:peptidoglycan/LPS O-acetylase OafA/YrhL